MRILEKVKKLMKSGSRLMIQAIGEMVAGSNVLHFYVERDNIERVKFLIKNGERVNKKDGIENTPLHVAAKLGKKEMVDLLIKVGADVEATNNAGTTPLHVANLYNWNGSHDEIITLLSK